MVKPPSASPSLAEVVPDPRNRDDGGATTQLFPHAAIKDSAWSFIRREGDDRESLFDLREDPNEQRNLADDPSAQTVLQRMREELERLIGGPLVPGRFK